MLLPTLNRQALAAKPKPVLPMQFETPKSLKERQLEPVSTASISKTQPLSMPNLAASNVGKPIPVKSGSSIFGRKGGVKEPEANITKQMNDILAATTFSPPETTEGEAEEGQAEVGALCILILKYF